MDNHYFGLGFSPESVKKAFSNYKQQYSNTVPPVTGQSDLDNQKTLITNKINDISTQETLIESIKKEISRIQHNMDQTDVNWFANCTTNGVWTVVNDSCTGTRNVRIKQADDMRTQVIDLGNQTDKLETLKKQLKVLQDDNVQMIKDFAATQLAIASTDPTLNQQQKDAEIAKLKIQAEKDLAESKAATDAAIASTASERSSSNQKIFTIVGVSLLALAGLITGVIVYKKQMKKP
mgnify:CR=1 FL=1|tara:strand:+ start:17523 stop:18227 length:705 start_codon:yes stop_codon:yes gene_type:complete